MLLSPGYWNLYQGVTHVCTSSGNKLLHHWLHSHVWEGTFSVPEIRLGRPLREVMSIWLMYPPYQANLLIHNKNLTFFMSLMASLIIRCYFIKNHKKIEINFNNIKSKILLESITSVALLWSIIVLGWL